MADYIKKIRTTTGDKEIDYEALANKPNSLPNPNKIKFTGSVVAEYDGSSEVTVDIPNGASEEQIRNSVNEYLDEHPVTSGATEEQATQIQTNTNNISELKEDISSLSEEIANGSGLTVTIKEALMNVVENIGLWKDGNGQTYIDALRTALYNAPLTSISAVYTQSKTIYASDDLEALKEDLVVTGTFTDGSSAVITDYTLSGNLTVGTSIITVAKDEKTATFEVIVTASRVPATGITLDKTTLSFTSGVAVQLTATVEPSNSTDTVVWSSSEDAVATVEDGLVTPQADGSCKIYATAGDITVECSVSVALPLSGINIENPYLMYNAVDPTTLGQTDEELQGKWYRALYNTWGNSLGLNSNLFLHPFTDGTFYIRMLGRTLSDPIFFYAFENADIVANPTATLGKVGDTYTESTVQQFISFEWTDYEGNKKSGTVNLGEWEYVDGRETTYGDTYVKLFKVTVPKDVYVFITTAEMGAHKFPGISNNYPYMNDLYTIFDSDPSANILQVVE